MIGLNNFETHKGPSGETKYLGRKKTKVEDLKSRSGPSKLNSKSTLKSLFFLKQPFFIIIFQIQI